MWRSSVSTLASAIVLLAIAPANTAAADDISIDQLAWLAGCWAMDGRDPGSVEHWLAPAGGAMLGISRVVRDGRMVSFEFMRIEETADGVLRFIAAPVGQAPTAFWLEQIEQSSATFANPDHDFPQRIHYERAGDRLLGRASASTDTGEVKLDFPMTRIACDAD
ncbi:MAG: DUF6265 family protein [Woeseiaceae bacterium]|nr:DUF6265 family protein [Woeseiaceae bacterium]